MTIEVRSSSSWSESIRDALGRLLRPELHPVIRLLDEQSITIEDVLGATDQHLSVSVRRPSGPGFRHEQGVRMTESPFHRQGISLDQRVALRTAAARLQERFAGTFNQETIERFLHHSYDEFAERATIDKWLPLLAERFARQRLTALARIDGSSDDTRPLVLFLCVHNAGRSQMAMGFFEHLAGGEAIAWSGGSEPTSQVNPAAVAAMAERGIDISGEFPKPWTDEVVRAADAVITMGCGDACPIFPGKRYEDWSVADPEGLEVADIRPIRDDIERRVRGLLESLPLAAASVGGV